MAGVSWIGPGAALLVGVYADLAFNLFSAMNSSPQTTELFADDRAETLWKYVKIADAAAVGFGIGIGLVLLGFTLMILQFILGKVKG